MADVFDKEKRSEIMRAVKSSKNKSTEEKLIAYFKENKITGWRRNYKVYGKPDFVLPDLRMAAFGMGIIAEIPIRNRIKNIGSVR